MEHYEFRNYPFERLQTDSLDSRLDSDEKIFRMRLIEYIIANKKPYNIYNLGDETSEVIVNIQLIEKLVEKRAAVLDNEGNISAVYPVSATETTHVVRLQDGRWFYAMSAIDALGVTFLFNQKIEIDSRCSKCDIPIRFTADTCGITMREIDTIHTLHIDLNQVTNRSGSACKFMNFFCSETHYKQWVEETGVKEDKIFCLNLDEAFQVAKMMFQMEPDLP